MAVAVSQERSQEQLNSDLLAASQAGEVKEVKTLLESGANVHTEDDYPLRLATLQRGEPQSQIQCLC